MKALILAAGYATRLYPLTKEYPKPLLTVGTRPIINYILDKLQDIEDIEETIVVTNNKFIHQFREWKESLHCSWPVTLVDDLTKSHKDRRGAIGDIFFVIEKINLKDGLLVIGGDNLFDGDLREFLSFADENKSSPLIGAYHLADIREAKNYGVIELDKTNRIIDFTEKPKRPKSRLIAMCLYYFPKSTLGLIGEYLKRKADKHDATGFYIDWLRKKIDVYGFVFYGRWYDIGDHKFYNEAKGVFSY